MFKRLQAFNVYREGKLIDTLFYAESEKMTAEEVCRSLVEHDGYPHDIKVTKAK